MIDLHSHILPGLDDGARDLEDSLEIARTMAADGIRIVAGTPHVRDDYPNSPEAVEDALARVREAVAQAGIPLEVRGGAEIALERVAEMEAITRRRFGLGGNPHLVLIEYPYYGRPLTLAAECLKLRSEGVVPVIAHPERNEMVQDRPADLEGIVRAGGIVQLTGASLDGRLGRASADCAHRLLEFELAHLIASDAHGPGRRQAGLSAAAASVGNDALGRWLTSGVPAALIEGEELPNRPPRSQRRRGLGRYLRR